jgi:hypothetical protein
MDSKQKSEDEWKRRGIDDTQRTSGKESNQIKTQRENKQPSSVSAFHNANRNQSAG